MTINVISRKVKTMKMNVFLRYLLGVTTLVAAAHLTTVNLAYAQAPLSQSSGAQAQTEYAPEELEQLRVKLLGVVDAIKEMADLLPDNAKDVERLEKSRTRIKELSDRELMVLRKSIDPAKIDSDSVGKARQTLADYNASELGMAQKMSRAKQSSKSGAIAPASAGFPTASPFCGANRLGGDAVLAADVIWFAADLIRQLATDTCLQTVVVLGEGGNTSLLCTEVDILWNIAYAIYAGVHFCEDDFTGAVVDANYARLDHLHTDLENSVANDNANTASIIANTNSKAASIIANANSNTATITTNANANTTTITTAIANAVSSINANVNANQSQLMNLILQTQIEADLPNEPA